MLFWKLVEDAPACAYISRIVASVSVAFMVSSHPNQYQIPGFQQLFGWPEGWALLRFIERQVHSTGIDASEFSCARDRDGQTRTKPSWSWMPGLSGRRSSRSKTLLSESIALLRSSARAFL